MELRDSLTIIYIPFEFAEGTNLQTAFDNSENWLRQTDLEIVENKLYTYASQFMSGKNTSGDSALIYKLKENAVCSFMNNKQYILRCDVKKDIKYNFRFCYGKNLIAPHIIIYPHCPVGVLMFGVELSNIDGNMALDDLAKFNYYLHKLDKQRPSIVLDKNSDKKGILAEKLYGSSENGTCMLDLCRKMLTEEICKNVKFLEPNRMHLFTYLQTVDMGDLDITAFKETLVQIASAETDAYQVTTSPPQPVELFRNIYLCSRNEGGVMATILNSGCNTKFFEGYKKDQFITEYLWIYTFLIMQYYAMIRFTNCLYRPVEHQNVDKTINQLWQIKKHIFVCISRYTHINKFYDTIVHNIGLRSLLKMLDENYNFMNNQNQTRIGEQTNTIITFLTVSQVVFAIFSFLSISVNWSELKFEPLMYVILLMLGVIWIAACIFMLFKHWSLIYNSFRFNKKKCRL